MTTIEKETQEIANFRKWEQAFRIFSGIYTESHPDRVNELDQYIETISSAADTYIWDNVHTYDQIFRQLIRAFPYRSWAVLYVHGWNLTLRDPIPKGANNDNFKSNNKAKSKGKKEVCWRFNKSRCNYGTS